MRTIVIISLFIVLCFFPVFAQEAGKLRAGLEIGYLYPHKGGFGSLRTMELKYNFKKNMNIGLKAETTNFRKHKNYDADLLSFSITYDYYFHSNGRRFSPFIGAGIGYFFCKSYDEEFINFPWKFNNPTCFIRAGIEFWKFRVLFNYNLVRKPTDTYQINMNIDYVSLNFGFYIGGGKWK